MPDSDKVTLYDGEHTVESWIPQSRIDKVKKSIGIGSGKPVRAAYVEGLDTAWLLEPYREDQSYLIALPTDKKKYSRRYLKHELTHMKLGRAVTEEEYRHPTGYTKEELLELLEEKKSYRAIDITTMVIDLVGVQKVPLTTAKKTVRQVALQLGYPKYIIERGLGQVSKYELVYQSSKEKR